MDSLAGAIGGGIGAAVGVGIESMFIWYQYKKGRISVQEAWNLTGISVASGAAAAGGFFAVVTAGALAGAPGGPMGVALGVTIGAVVAGILCGFAARYGCNKAFEHQFRKKNAMDIKLREEALEMFFDDRKFNIDNEDKFNDKIIQRKYHKLARLYHPDAIYSEIEDEERQEKWLKLSAYYGILIGIWENQKGIDLEMNSSEDLDEEQCSSVINEAIRERARESIPNVTDDE